MINKNLHLPQTKNNNNTERDGFDNETISRDSFSGFVKLFSDSRNRMHETLKSKTSFG